jgi:hypothetical protein
MAQRNRPGPGAEKPKRGRRDGAKDTPSPAAKAAEVAAKAAAIMAKLGGPPQPKFSPAFPPPKFSPAFPLSRAEREAREKEAVREKERKRSWELLEADGPRGPAQPLPSPPPDPEQLKRMVDLLAKQLLDAVKPAPQAPSDPAKPAPAGKGGGKKPHKKPRKKQDGLVTIRIRAAIAAIYPKGDPGPSVVSHVAMHAAIHAHRGTNPETESPSYFQVRLVRIEDAQEPALSASVSFHDF